MKPFYSFKGKGICYFRIFGKGLLFRNLKTRKMLITELNEKAFSIQLGYFHIKLLY